MDISYCTLKFVEQVTSFREGYKNSQHMRASDHTLRDDVARYFVAPTTNEETDTMVTYKLTKRMVLALLSLALVSPTLASGFDLRIDENPTLATTAPGTFDILTVDNGGTIKRCCGTRACIQCNFVDFSGKFPALREGDVLRIKLPAAKELWLCPNNEGIAHQCREVRILEKNIKEAVFQKAP